MTLPLTVRHPGATRRRAAIAPLIVGFLFSRAGVGEQRGRTGGEVRISAIVITSIAETRILEPQATLERADLVDHVLPRSSVTLGGRIFGRKDHDRERGTIEEVLLVAPL